MNAHVNGGEVRGVSRRGMLGGLVGLFALAGMSGLVLGIGGCSGDAAGAGAGAAADEGGGEGASGAADAGTEPHGPFEFTDDLGRRVIVEDLARVVACMGSFAKVWELAGGSLVGVTDDALADYPDLDLPEDVAVVGSFTDLNIEQIAAIRPTLVLLSAASGGRGNAASQADLEGALDDLGLTTAFFKVTVFDDYLRMLRCCCDLTGRDDLYRENGEEVGERIADVLATVPEQAAAGNGPLVAAMVTYSGGVRLQDASTMVGSMLADLGARNVADQEPSLLRDYSVESLLACDPDVLLVVPLGNDEKAAREALKQQTEDDPAWSTLTAVREGRFYTLDPQLFQYKPLERWDESYQVLWGYLYGEGADGEGAADGAGDPQGEEDGEGEANADR